MGSLPHEAIRFFGQLIVVFRSSFYRRFFSQADTERVQFELKRLEEQKLKEKDERKQREEEEKSRREEERKRFADEKVKILKKKRNDNEF